MSTQLQKIVAIGGGEIGHTKTSSHGEYVSDTSVIDREILHLTGKKAPTLLFIPTASNDSKSYSQKIKKHFLKIGFASVDTLYLSDESLTEKQLKETILSHDAIYVGGGNTLKLLKVWRKMDIDKMLNLALKKGIVLSGLSAGSICWFSKGVSSSKSYGDENKKYVQVTGLGFINAVHFPHFSEDQSHKQAIKTTVMNSSKVAVCLDDLVALVILGNKYKIIKANNSSGAYKAYWKDNKYYLKKIVSDESLKDLDGLLSKS